MISGLANGFPDGRLYAIIGRQRGEEYEKNKAYVYQEDVKAGFLNVYLPSTLKRVGANVFYCA